MDWIEILNSCFCLCSFRPPALEPMRRHTPADPLSTSISPGSLTTESLYNVQRNFMSRHGPVTITPIVDLNENPANYDDDVICID